MTYCIVFLGSRAQPVVSAEVEGVTLVASKVPLRARTRRVQTVSFLFHKSSKET